MAQQQRWLCFSAATSDPTQRQTVIIDPAPFLLDFFTDQTSDLEKSQKYSPFQTLTRGPFGMQWTPGPMDQWGQPEQSFATLYNFYRNLILNNTWKK